VATQSELYAALVAAGMPAGRARIGSAVGMAESSGNLRAHNAKPPDNSYGPWQINMIGVLGPARRAAYGLRSNEDLFNLATSAKVATAISHNGANWAPWSTYKNGAYKRYMTGSDSAAGGSVSDAISAGWFDEGKDALKAPFDQFGGALPDFSIDAIGKLVNAVEKTASWVSDASNWVRVLYVIGGVVVTVVGLDMIIASTSPGRAAQKVAGNVAGAVAKRTPVGAAASAAAA
jgi:hypothetical protein